MGSFWYKIFKKRKKEEEIAESQAIAEQRRLLKITLLNTSEGSVFLAGVTLSLIYTAWLAAKFVFTPESAQILIGMTAVEVMFGRAAGMAFGYGQKLGHSTVIPICMILETILVLIAYPLFVFSWRHLLVIKSLKRIFDRIHQTAETHKVIVHKYGIIGLFAFVWFPFWMTGPVVGCVIGFLMGLPVWLDLIVVLSGTYVAILGWAIILHTFNEQVAEYSPYAAMTLMVIILLLIIIGHLLSQAIQENKRKNSKS
jgi:uncharacterized membrane protein